MVEPFPWKQRTPDVVFKPFHLWQAKIFWLASISQGRKIPSCSFPTCSNKTLQHHYSVHGCEYNSNISTGPTCREPIVFSSHCKNIIRNSLGSAWKCHSNVIKCGKTIWMLFVERLLLQDTHIGKLAEQNDLAWSQNFHICEGTKHRPHFYPPWRWTASTEVWDAANLILIRYLQLDPCSSTNPKVNWQQT